MPFTFPVRKESDEVYYADCGIVRIGLGDLDELKRIALGNPRRRARLCTHGAPSDLLHEMFIVHARDAYVRPHRHLLRREGMTVLEGEADMILFNDDGKVTGVSPMNTKQFYQRMNIPIYHMQLIRSDVLVFHEATSGPFDRVGTEFAPWSPSDDDRPAVSDYIHQLEREIRPFLHGRPLP